MPSVLYCTRQGVSILCGRLGGGRSEIERRKVFPGSDIFRPANAISKSGTWVPLERQEYRMSATGLPFLTQKEGETLLSAYIQPRAGKSGFAGIFQDRLKIRVNAPPADGEANQECMEFLSKSLGIPKSEIRLTRGGQSRQKTFLISRPFEFVRERLESAGLGG